MDGAPHLGRPVEVDSDQIDTLIENNQHYAMWEIAETLKIHKTIVIGDNEKCVFYFMEKNHTDFLADPISLSHQSKTICFVSLLSYA